MGAMCCGELFQPNDKYVKNNTHQIIYINFLSL